MKWMCGAWSGVVNGSWPGKVEFIRREMNIVRPIKDIATLDHIIYLL